MSWLACMYVCYTFNMHVSTKTFVIDTNVPLHKALIGRRAGVYNSGCL